MNKVVLLAFALPLPAMGQIIQNPPKPGDVVISEIMADPLPVVSLPAKEYIELENTTYYTVNLKNWTLTDGKSKARFPDTAIDPGGRIIVCSTTETSLLESFGKTVGIKSFPALTDGGKILALSDSSGILIHGVEYSRSWYGDELKADGGWSLEMIDTAFPFSGGSNWHASNASEGGTPGRANSVAAKNPDSVFEGIMNVFPSDSNSIMLYLSETVFDLESNTEFVLINGDPVLRISPANLLLREFNVTPAEPLLPRTSYSLGTGNAVTDFAGNSMLRNEFSFGIPEKASKGDIVFNELLFNPLPGEPDYIEFYNASGKIIDASGLRVASVNDATTDTSSLIRLPEEARCIMPGNYYVVTTDKTKVTERFFLSADENIFEISSLPSMPDDNGHLLLFNRELVIIDEVIYDEEMQYSLLQDPEGIALEKVRPANSPAGSSSWHTASEASGWGTPGCVNSVYVKEPASDDRVTLSSTRITPDYDGNEDILVIDLKFEGNGNVVSVDIFDETGGFVRRLTDNFLAGPEAAIIWNGTDADGDVLRTGIYVMLISVFDANGKLGRWKKVCTVINR
ncbi:MAG: lamin tail domain-containing protein [Bacteroidales bacterium]